MEFRVVDETLFVPKLVHRIFGPCLLCGVEMEYPPRVTVLGVEWLEKVYNPLKLEKYKAALRDEVNPYYAKGPTLNSLERLLCWRCKGDVIEQRRKDAEQCERAIRALDRSTCIDGTGRRT